jgi:ABC-2 type transport system permease protein
MKVLDIALKDMLRSFRSGFAVVMMFVAPLLIAGLIYFAFGGLGGDGGFELPLTRVQVVNLDEPGPQFSFSFGQMLAEFLQREELADLLQATVAATETDARAAVDNQEAGVAVIIPPDFTTAALATEGRATVTLYQDPTLTLGPSIVKGIVSQFVDSFAGTKIATGVVADQLGQRGVAMDAGLMQDVATQYAAWAEALGESWNEEAQPMLDIQPPPGQSEQAGQKAIIFGAIMAGQVIFFTFFTGAYTAETIIREDEEGTLARLFTTPTPQALILGGKFVAVFLTIAVQAVVLMVATAIIFGIRWGHPFALALVTIGMVVSAAGFGVLLMSFVKNTRQSGPVLGGVLTVIGMAGGLFTTGFQNLPAAYETINLLTPHGWALRGWKAVLAGGGVSAVLLPTLVTLGMGVVFFAVGTLVFRRRFT